MPIWCRRKVQLLKWLDNESMESELEPISPIPSSRWMDCLYQMQGRFFFLSVLSVDVFSAPIFNVNVAAAVVVVKLIIWHNLDRLIQRSLLLPSSRFFSSQTNLIVVSLSRKHHPHTVYLFLLLHIHSTPRYFKKGLTFKHKLSCSNYVGFADQLWCHIWSALWLSPTMAPPLALFTFA